MSLLRKKKIKSSSSVKGKKRIGEKRITLCGKIVNFVLCTCEISTWQKQFNSSTKFFKKLAYLDSVFFLFTDGRELKIIVIQSTLCESDFLRIKKTGLALHRLFFRNHAFDELIFDHYVLMSYIGRTYLAIFLQCVRRKKRNEARNK